MSSGFTWATAVALLAAAWPPTAMRAQDSVTAVPALSKRAVAVRVPDGTITVDGRLGETAWRTIPAITDFVQKQPSEGAAPTERTEIRVAYDDGALYIGARMYAKDPAKIQAPIGRRDNIGQMEHLLVSLDTYRDRRTAYTFGVTASGVRADWYHPTDNESNTDASFEPVWEAQSHMDSLGWTAEMRIPFNQLRFNPGDAQTWGINFDRWIPSTNEDIFWIPVPSNVTAWSSRMGTLEGIQGIRPTRRIELLPYVAGEARRASDRNRANPFDDGRNLQSRIGGDVKLGLGPSLTLQATINPDFGQVEADPSVVNLSAFEIFYSERRPFFTEGSRYLTGGGATYFYSRRIGGAPRVRGSGDFVDQPNASTILGATKLTGRLPSGLSVGALAALTDEEFAAVYDSAYLDTTVTPAVRVSARHDRTRVEPRAMYGVVRAQQEFGKSGSTVGFIATGVRRSLGDADPLAARLPGDAVTGAVDWVLRLKGGEYQITGDFGVSRVGGDTAAIRRLQTSSARYYQRPDADYVELDPTRTSLSGINSSLVLERISGKHWLGYVMAFARTPGFDLNDAGAMSRADQKFLEGMLIYRERKPGKILQNYQYSLDVFGQQDFGNVLNTSFVRADANYTFKNFWTANLTAWNDFPGLSNSLTRGGPYMGTGHYRVGIVEVGNSFAAKTRWSGRVYYGRTTLGELTYRVSGSFGIRPVPQWQLTITPNFLGSRDPRQYIATTAGGRPETFGRRYVFSTVDLNEFTLSARLNYTLKPDLTLEMFAEPYAVSGRYSDFGELLKPRSRELLPYAEDFCACDFNERSLRTNSVVRWEWRPGSTFFAVWQRNGRRQLDAYRRVDPADAFGSFQGAYTNFFALKMNFWIPVGG